MKKKITSLALALTLSLSSATMAADLGQDIDKIVKEAGNVVAGAQGVVASATTKIAAMFDIVEHWGKQYIKPLLEKEIISGYPDGSFKPDAQIKVSEFTKLLVVAVSGEPAAYGSVWYDKYTNKATQLGIILPGEFNNFEKAITREEMARMSVRALGQEVENSNTSFSDDAQITPEFKGYINEAVRVGIVGGYPDGTFKPQGQATRAEASKMLSVVLELKENGVPKKEEKEVRDVTTFRYVDLDTILPEGVIDRPGINDLENGGMLEAKNSYFLNKSDLPVKTENFEVHTIEKRKWKEANEWVYITKQKSYSGDTGMFMWLVDKEFKKFRGRNYFRESVKKLGNYFAELEYPVTSPTDPENNWADYQGKDARYMVFRDPMQDFVLFIDLEK